MIIETGSPQWLMEIVPVKVNLLLTAATREALAARVLRERFPSFSLTYRTRFVWPS